MQAHPNLAGIAGFDAGSGPGIATAIREAGKSGKIKAVGNDVNTAQIQALKDGSMQFVLGQKRKFFGYWGVMSLYMSIKSGLEFTADDEKAGIANFPPRIITGFIYVTEDNADLIMEESQKYANMQFSWGN